MTHHVETADDGTIAVNGNRRDRPHRPPRESPLADSREFHRTIPGYAPTPLIDLPALAAELGVARVVVKNEALRFGLPAYKVLGAAWALHEAIRRRVGRPDGTIVPCSELADVARPLGPVTLCTATDGNHGRAVAAMASRVGFASRVFVPSDMVAERVEAITSHGAHVTRVGGGYDEAVDAARDLAERSGAWLCADTARGDESADAMAFAADVQRGYHTLFAESVEQLAGAPDLLFIQAGVGALAASAAAFADAHGLATQIVTVEPVGSACVQASIQHGEPTAVLDTFTTMAGLRAQHVSALAWPVLRDRITAAVSVSETQAEAAMRILATQHVVAGESGAAGLAGLVRVGHAPWARRALGVRHSTTIAVVNTEGATDAERYARVVGPHGVAPRA